MLLQNLRAKVGARLNGDSESGFTLIELLVVMLILGILAAIALPAFFNQKDKAGDAKAKETAHSAQVAMETCATDNNGKYGGTEAENCDTPAKLKAIEPTLPSTGLTVPTHTATTYKVTVAAPSGNTFSIENNAGTMSYTCTVPSATADRGGCPGTGTTGNWG